MAGNRAAAALLAVGLLQMGADLLGLPALKGLAAATAIAPAPKVFSAVQGLETFSTRFFVEWNDPVLAEHRLELTPAINARLRGPYNRRNVFGAVLAYGPVLQADPRTRPMFESAARYALCGDAPVLRELGIDPARVAGRVRVRLVPRPGTAIDALPPVLEAPCP
jgi:hypothetical protein